ncbi:Fpg/Nei family DNA glycosylase [Mycobacterium talmoniae]|uniref:Formamidopyrimidine-DNA glycosylase n=1 Tax=Mycobacterium talmoniae TaxID=1858794 RepID=A0A1S1NF59_9MYCO|nr:MULTISPECIES: DNA-formamidopyrimidine glycosylase family protein [Mycobacterium]OHU99782.1 formamidopyrimidine-DNA glycosylase [Mycobacterium talmoniae]PQM49606.1 Formamidopyrimidine-DNA glycosylase 1 [Mycobacterium talmoniae]TDH48673.1 Fpg/Nei family DNA glycosylase [Mycobacterium eburneum]
MPELPDVEGFRRALAGALPGRRVCRVQVSDPGVLRNTSPQGLGQRLAGQRFDRPDRHGKWLMLPTAGPVLLIHSGMTGHPYYLPDGADEPDARPRMVITLDRGQLRYADQRKLRGVWLAATADDVTDIVGEQGPDALAVTFDVFAAVLSRRRGQLKPALLDQAVLAGLGNLLTDEICWQARLHPARAVPDLGGADRKALYQAMRRVLRTSVRHGRVPDLRGWLTGVRDAPDPRCPRCRTHLASDRIGGRTSWWCPHCQSR